VLLLVHHRLGHLQALLLPVSGSAVDFNINHTVMSGVSAVDCKGSRMTLYNDVSEHRTVCSTGCYDSAQMLLSKIVLVYIDGAAVYNTSR
jgi:hypothetical protein